MRNLSRLFVGGPGRENAASGWPNRWPEITDPQVRAAFVHVDRALFLPEGVREWASRDAPLPIGEGQTISQPFVIALMVQALRLKPGDRVLEIGTGSGYQTAILCEVTHETGRAPGENVFSVERYPSLANRAMRDLRAAGYAPHVRMGDGAEGWPEMGPYAGIVVSAAATAVPRTLTQQLVEGGRLLIPVGPPGDEQELLLVERGRDGLRVEYLGPVRFVPLISDVLNDASKCLALPLPDHNADQF